jgi:hypothetical protein
VWRASSYSPLALDLPNDHGRRRRSAAEVHVLTQHRTDAI